MKILLTTFAALILATPAISAADTFQGARQHLTRSKSSASHANKGGHYAGGHGSSHKGGHYKNPRTHNHYQKHN